MGMVLVVSGGHAIVPEPGTVIRESDGRPGSLLRVFDYPVHAVCITCGQAVRTARMLLAEWEHIDIPGRHTPET